MAKNQSKKPRSQTSGAKRKAVEETEWQIHEPYNGDESEVQWNDEGSPRPGTAWEVAMNRAEQLKQKRQPKISHLGVLKVYEQLDIGTVWAGWHYLTDENNKRRGKFIRLEEVTRTEWSKFEIEKPFLMEGRLRMHTTVEECGRAVVLAYLNKDHGFFDALAKVAAIEFGVRRKKAKTNEEMIIEMAVELWHDWQGNPSREAVIQAVKSSGVKIRSKDWPAYFKRCKLDFLKSHKGAGRPRTPEPLERFVIENPKGEFKIHRATKSEGERMKFEAAQEMRRRAEAEEGGEEDIPF